jgi:TRAP-type C4-dicarboxylate transport system permease small subunit
MARLDEMIGRIEQTIVVVALFVMIVLAFSQIVLRNAFATGLSWGDPLVRYLVLWVGFIGASIATLEGRHINIDVISRWIPGRAQNLTHFVVHLFSTFVCGILAYAAFRFVVFEAQMGDSAFLEIPTWILQLVLPLAMCLMTLRFGLRAYRSLARGQVRWHPSEWSGREHADLTYDRDAE